MIDSLASLGQSFQKFFWDFQVLTKTYFLLRTSLISWTLHLSCAQQCAQQDVGKLAWKANSRSVAGATGVGSGVLAAGMQAHLLPGISLPVN
jgi:hypothetical protein